MNITDIMFKDFSKISPDAEISEIAKIFNKNIDAEILVMNNTDELLGIITHTELLYKDIEPEHPMYFELLGGIIYVNNISLYQEELKKLTSTKASEIMCNKVFTISVDTSIEAAGKLMVEKRIGHLPILKDGKVIGIIRKKDIVKYIISLLI